MITENTGYFEGPVTVGVHLIDGVGGVLIDSGSDDSAARKILGHFEKKGISILGIINTHSHADHCGGNALIQKRSGAPVFAVGLEAHLIERTELEPIYLYGAGAPSFMENKFLKAPPTLKVEKVSFGTLNIGGVHFELLDYSGHSPVMTGVRTPDGVLFIGDALIGPQTAEKHGLLYHFDLRKHMKTLEHLRSLEDELCVLSHGGLCTHPGDVAIDNLNRLNHVNERLIQLAQGGIGRETLLERLMEDMGITPPPSLYYLNLGLVSSHLTYLCETDQMTVQMEGCSLRYYPVI